jgi:ribosomal protein S27AE
MPLKFPNSMDECVYFTRRNVGEGKVVAWVFRETCPKCKKSVMGKPKDPKTGRPKIRAKEYTCESCMYTVPGEEYEDSLTVSIQYTCPHCKNSSEAQVPFKRKKVKIFDEEEQKSKSVDVIRFICGKCSKNVDITKKMK